MIIIDSSTLANQSLATALLCHTYTAKADRQILIRLFADQIAGNGNYTAYLTVQKLGAGSAYEAGARTTVLVPSGVTAQMFPTISLSVKETDVVKVYLLGLAGDTTTPDIATEVWDADPLTQFQGVASAGTANTITLAATNSPATNDLIKGEVLRIRGGTGTGQSRAIIGYVASTKVATVGRNWVVNPDATSAYEVISLSVPRINDNLEVYSNLVSILGTAITETAGQIAAGFKKLFDVAVPVLTAASVNQTGDAFARVGAAGAGLTAIPNSAGVTTILADYARRTGDYATVAALTTLQGNVTTILTDYARRTGDYATVAALTAVQSDITAILNAVDTEVAAILASVNAFSANYARRTGDYAITGAAMTLTAGERTAISTARDAAILEGALSHAAALRLILAAAAAGNTTGMGTLTGHIRDVANTKDRVVATIDVDGNRTVTALDGS